MISLLQPERKFCDLVRKVIEKEIDGDSEREGKGVRDREGNNNNNNNNNGNNKTLLSWGKLVTGKNLHSYIYNTYILQFILLNII